jgi:hypothetical protein
MIAIIFICIALLAAGIIWYDNQSGTVFKHPTQKKMAWSVLLLSLFGTLFTLIKGRRR